ncbi:MAG: protoheme IX farnesyltransferase, partial [Gammaproteobacteria bacterium]|nr:protoheme IX farnesyltransferase [Gammaproteobacteria bacterium]
AAAGVPMLPVVIGDRSATWVILANTVLLVGVSVLPAFYDFSLGWIYLCGAVAGGLWFIFRNIQLVMNPCKSRAMSNFFASLIQLTLVLICAILDIHLLS